MVPDLATLPKGQEPMPLEDWPKHSDCTLKPREHKWQWEYNGEGQTSATNAVCVHCGKREMISRRGPPGVTP